MLPSFPSNHHYVVHQQVYDVSDTFPIHTYISYLWWRWWQQAPWRCCLPLSRRRSCQNVDESAWEWWVYCVWLYPISQRSYQPWSVFARHLCTRPTLVMDILMGNKMRPFFPLFLLQLQGVEGFPAFIQYVDVWRIRLMLLGIRALKPYFLGGRIWVVIRRNYFCYLYSKTCKWWTKIRLHHRDLSGSPDVFHWDPIFEGDPVVLKEEPIQMDIKVSYIHSLPITVRLTKTFCVWERWKSTRQR